MRIVAEAGPKQCLPAEARKANLSYGFPLAVCGRWAADVRLMSVWESPFREIACTQPDRSSLGAHRSGRKPDVARAGDGRGAKRSAQVGGPALAPSGGRTFPRFVFKPRKRPSRR